MNCCQCQGIEDLFSEALVNKELSRYRAHGPDKTTRMLIDALISERVQGLTLLDIGGGVGAIQKEMIRAGVAHATDVEASTAYLAAAKTEAGRGGYAERVDFLHGNFVDLAADLPPADIVTLDRVICCYHDMEELVGRSIKLAGKLYGLVYPRDTWWTRIGLAVENLYFRLKRNSFRTFVHPTKAVEAIVSSHGFSRRYYKKTLVWQVVVYSR